MLGACPVLIMEFHNVVFQLEYNYIPSNLWYKYIGLKTWKLQVITNILTCFHMTYFDSDHLRLSWTLVSPL